MKDRIKQHFLEAASVLDQFLSDEHNIEKIASAGNIMVQAIRSGKKIISCGNGGSMCDAMHFAEELSGRYRDDRPALPALSISDPSHLSCVGNDYGYPYVFSRYIEAIGQKGDVLLAISTSGNSENILLAIEAARKKNMEVIGLTGKTGGKMAGWCDVEIRAPQSPYADRAQEIHIKIIHSFIDFIEQHL
ncbi:phosphoheptose isomerase [Anseongella ginsenosidimutans]|uniref:Phosphoheptose isomerase n=1 Tax=Anseongella ginsenosidimutans TaxID=496056 RepID=A0A4R3KQD2_9SPHI|nr:D-sedoheptulose 7-phosphate isomerase [Anseongella ginsenosidimutans]QEC52047.1 D-sedoheptulose 7-phosphate isomerase [Anseongella ginsenosidimutans]TCS85645.1 phosphoheptose isomerase [Anseongella ginsenosidimutans]